ncbi:pyridoxamine 5'-phosphate oxidase family protein [Halorussus caseinilyticus]|uniref:Pyridoxamine 5'-phosphate oxidase family protein n=1 Tax=Halorussus caseinilyticus TaxID=3034025 RepID=A0ABD5WLL1_9EURY|nr:pyridoxamine 5'-phosphate oxidase family protein [Halorussus sp. DT72]
MEGLRWVQLTEQERDEFLGTGGTGTLSFATDETEPPFSLPVSYGYDADAGSFYFRLAFPENSGKRSVVDHPVTFVTHDRTDRGWRSVVATGELEDVTDRDYDSAAVQGMWAVDIPKVDVFEDPPEEVSFRQFRLVPERLTGRKEVESGG